MSNQLVRQLDWVTFVLSWIACLSSATVGLPLSSTVTGKRLLGLEDRDWTVIETILINSINFVVDQTLELNPTLPDVIGWGRFGSDSGTTRHNLANKYPAQWP